MTDHIPDTGYIGDAVPEQFVPAVNLLTQHGFTLVEYGFRALPKYGYPMVVSVSQASPP